MSQSNHSNKLHYCLLLFAFFLWSGLSSFTAPLTESEYLSITIEYNYHGMFIYINGPNQVYRKIKALGPLTNESTYHQKKRAENIALMKRKGFEVWEIAWNGKYDDKMIFNLLAEYESKGWELQSHNFDVIWDNNYMRETRIEKYLLSRKLEE